MIYTITIVSYFCSFRALVFSILTVILLNSDCRSQEPLVFSAFGDSGGPFECSDDTITWISDETSTAGASEALLSTEIECKGIGNFEDSDVLTISYRIDKGPWMPLIELSEDFRRTTFSTPLTLRGKSMQLKIEAKTSASNEIYLVHKLVVDASESSKAPSFPPDNSIDPKGGMQTSKGTLIIDGGSLKREPEKHTIKAFIKHVGGLNQPIVVSPTASSVVTDAEWKEYYEAWNKTIGFKTVSKMHSPNRDPVETNTDAFVKDLKQARGLFIRGGRQWRLVDAYGNADQQTATLKEMWKLLERGGVIAGTSAGATIQGDFLPRGATRGSGTMISDDAMHRQGFAFLPNVAFDVHVAARGRVTHLYEVLKYANDKGKDLLGIGIDEDTAIVVQGKVFQVIGSGSVFVHTWNDADEGGRILILKAGDKYNLCTRERFVAAR